MDEKHDSQNLYLIDPAGGACHPMPGGFYDPRPDPSYSREPVEGDVVKKFQSFCLECGYREIGGVQEGPLKTGMV
jgi:hypothetical protein